MGGGIENPVGGKLLGSAPSSIPQLAGRNQYALHQKLRCFCGTHDHRPVRRRRSRRSGVRFWLVSRRRRRPQRAHLEQGPKETAFAIHGGYRLTRYLAIEANYADLGNFSYTAVCSAVCVPELFPQQVDHSVKRLDVALLGIVPFGERVEAYARVGAARTETDTTASSMWETSSRSSDTSDLAYGLGLRVHLQAPWSLRLQWERSSADTGVPGASDADVDALWLGAEYRFAR